MNLRQLTRADVAIAFAVLMLLGATVRPALRARAYRGLVEQATADVAALRSAAIGVRRGTSTWPAASPPGEVPSALAPRWSDRPGFTLDGYTLEWTSLAVIEYVEAPPRPAVAPEDEQDPDTSPPVEVVVDLPPDSVGPEMVPSVRDIGAIVVHTGNESLLADLLAEYGPTVSYVRDTTWTLVVDDRAGSTP